MQTELQTLEMIIANSEATIKQCKKRIQMLNKPVKKVNVKKLQGMAAGHANNQKMYKTA